MAPKSHKGSCPKPRLWQKERGPETLEVRAKVFELLRVGGSGFRFQSCSQPMVYRRTEQLPGGRRISDGLASVHLISPGITEPD